MPSLFFADNTVLVNFGLIKRMDLLERILGGKGRWCSSIETECSRSASKPGLSQMADAANFLGSAIYPNPVERIQTQIYRDRLAGPGDVTTDHLGEAETLAIMDSRYSEDFLITDDGGAQRLAIQLGITYVTTWKLLQLITRAELTTCVEMLDYLEFLRARDRGAPDLKSVGAVRSWANMPPAPVID